MIVKEKLREKATLINIASLLVSFAVTPRRRQSDVESRSCDKFHVPFVATGGINRAVLSLSQTRHALVTTT